MITCRELIETLDAYVADELDPLRRQTIEKHLSVCPDCVNYVDSYRKTIRMGKLAFENLDATVPATVPAGIVKAVLAAREPRKTR